MSLSYVIHWYSDGGKKELHAEASYQSLLSQEEQGYGRCTIRSGVKAARIE